MKHLNVMSKVMLATGLIVAYGYSIEAFMAVQRHHYERFMLLNRMTGPYWWSYWGLILTNVLIPQLLWFERFGPTWSCSGFCRLSSTSACGSSAS